MSQAETGQRLTLGGALRDLGWFPMLFALVVGGPSLLSIMQHIFVDHRLIEALQWIVDGYNGAMAVLGAALEPTLHSIIGWLNDRLHWRLELDPVWRPLFTLTMVSVVSLARTGWRDGVDFETIFICMGGALGGLFGAVVAGLGIGGGGWWAQGLAATFPLAAAIFTLLLFSTIFDLFSNSKTTFVEYVGFTAINSVLIFLIGAGLYFIPGLSGAAGILAIGIFLVLAGLLLVWGGLAEDERSMSRMGLMILGGFLAAGFILLADFAVRNRDAFT